MTPGPSQTGRRPYLSWVNYIHSTFTVSDIFSRVTLLEDMANPKSIIVSVQPPIRRRRYTNREKFFSGIVLVFLLLTLIGFPVIYIAGIRQGGKLGYPGATLQLAKNLLVNSVEEGCREAEKNTAEVSFGDVVDIHTNDGQFIISQLRLTSLTLPIALNDVQPSSDSSWGIKQGRLSATGTWTYHQNVGNNMMNSSGFIKILQTTFSAQLNTTLDQNSDHHRAVNITCRIHMDEPKMSLSSSNDLSTLFNVMIELQPNLIEIIENVLESPMCDLIRTILQTTFDKFVETN